MKGESNSTLAVLDAYRADAAEREAALRTIEKRNRVLEAENALRSRELLFMRDAEHVVESFGLFGGGCMAFTIDAIKVGANDAAVIWGSLAGLFLACRVIYGMFVRGQRRD